MSRVLALGVFFLTLLHHLAHAVPVIDVRAPATDVAVDVKASVSYKPPQFPKPPTTKCFGKPPAKDEPFWLEKIKHQGKAPFNPDPAGYKVFRNVKDFGAVGDGIHDDTAAINAAITSQNRCGGGTCKSSTVSPGVIYFPRGKYLVTDAIIPYYYTQLIGDARNPPTLVASANFSGKAVIDADPRTPDGTQYWGSTNNFFKSVRNFIIDLRQVADDKTGTGIHWQVAQATSIINVLFEMSTSPTTTQRGVYMEDGSGGYMGDMVFNGGASGISGGNQQFTVRNITVNNARTGVISAWNWVWTYQGIKFNNLTIGFDITTGGTTSETQSTGAQSLIDVEVTNTGTFIRTSKPSNGSLAGSLMLDNVKLTNVDAGVAVLNGSVVLAGSGPGKTKTIAAWAQGNKYTGSNPHGTFVQGDVPAPHKAQSLLTREGKIVGRAHPQYENYGVEDFVSVRDHGVVGDGKTDDTEALQDVLDKYANCKIIFLDAGYYIITKTLTISPGTRLVGEGWSVLAGKGKYFQDSKNPKPVVRVGDKGDEGVIEITDIVFTTVGSAPGAIVIEWNIREPENLQAGAGMWDSHVRLAGSRGTELEGDTCPKFTDESRFTPCSASYLGLHITPFATGYFEGTWIWLADHDLDRAGENQLTAFSARGLFSESQGPVWMIGTASEHHAIYQYNLVNANAHYMGLIQTESPYYQPTVPATAPFSLNPGIFDPTPYNNTASSWAVNVKNSRNILIYGAGLYSFFVNYTQDCIPTRNCQAQILNVDSYSDVAIYSLSTVATTFELSINSHGVIDENDNRNGFQSTATIWTRF